MKKQIFTLMLSFMLLASQAQSPIAPDTGFYNNGWRKTDIAGGQDYGYAVTGQADGKVVIAGSADTASRRYAALSRLTTEGMYDNTFTATGKRKLPVGSGDAEIRDIAIDANGKIVCVGSTGPNQKSTIFRLNSGSSVDGSFGNSGYYTTNVQNATYEVLLGVAIQPDGKILTCGTTGVNNNRKILLKRFTTAGLPDSTFDTEGVVTTDLGGVIEEGRKVILQPDGKILVAGQSGSNMALVRYNPNGTPDLNFGAGGSVISDFGYTELANSVALQADGHILLVGKSTGRPDPSSLVLKLKSNGTLDSAFASFGKFEFAFNGSSEATAVEALADGNILVVGNTELNGVTRINLTRLLSDGTFDNSFAANEGSTTFSFLAGGERCDDMVMLNGSRMATVCSVVGVGQSDMFVTMFLLDLSVGLVDADMASNQILVYPNPVLSDFQLKYDLPSDQALTITLTDMSGRVVHTWVSNEMNAAGEHQLTLQRPDNIVAGHYLLHIQGQHSSQTIHVNFSH